MIMLIETSQTLFEVTKWQYVEVMGCLSTTSFAILINGKAKVRFQPLRVLRQRDPLSPFFFTLVGDVLSRIIHKAEMVELVKGFPVGKDRIHMQQLQFAITVLFSKHDNDSISRLLLILRFSGYIYGHKINLAKSSLYGINMPRIGCRVWLR